MQDGVRSKSTKASLGAVAHVLSVGTRMTLVSPWNPCTLVCVASLAPQGTGRGRAVQKVPAPEKLRAHPQSPPQMAGFGFCNKISLLI